MFNEKLAKLTKSMVAAFALADFDGPDSGSYYELGTTYEALIGTEREAQQAREIAYAASQRLDASAYAQVQSKLRQLYRDIDDWQRNVNMIESELGI